VMSYGCDLIRLSDEAKARGLFLYFTFLGLQKEVVGDPLIEAIAKALSVISASASLEGLKEDPVVRAYRDFYWRLGIDPTKVRPSSEALARRALRGEFRLSLGAHFYCLRPLVAPRDFRLGVGSRVTHTSWAAVGPNGTRPPSAAAAPQAAWGIAPIAAEGPPVGANIINKTIAYKPSHQSPSMELPPG